VYLVRSSVILRQRPGEATPPIVRYSPYFEGTAGGWGWGRHWAQQLQGTAEILRIVDLES
jgi:hypothetical protein